MTKEGRPTKPVTLNRSITNSNLTDGVIVGQGHKVVVIDSASKSTAVGPSTSDDLDYERKRHTLKISGINVDETIRNVDSQDLDILGQGQKVILNGVDLKVPINDARAQQAQQGHTTK